MAVFNVGDKVRFVKEGLSPFGLIGTVICVLPGGVRNYGVSFDNYQWGHTCGNYCEDGTGWWCDASEIQILEDEADIEYSKADILGILQEVI